MPQNLNQIPTKKDYNSNKHFKEGEENKSVSLSEHITFSMWLTPTLLHLLMDSIKHGNEKLMRILLFISGKVCCVLPPTETNHQQNTPGNTHATHKEEEGPLKV